MGLSGAKTRVYDETQEHFITAVDEAVVEGNGEPVYVWMAEDAQGDEATSSAYHSPTRTADNALSFRADEKRDVFVGTPRYPPTEDPDTKTPRLADAGLQNQAHQTLSPRSTVERFFGNHKYHAKTPYNINPKKNTLTLLLDCLKLFLKWYTQCSCHA